MLGKIEQEIKDSLKTMEKSIADLSRATAIDHGMLSRHLNGTYTLRPELLERMNNILTGWNKEFKAA
jgi:hypothetical protein